MRLLPVFLLCAAAWPSPEPETPAPREFVQAVEFPYYLYPRPLWERELVWLKTIGIRTVAFSIPWNWHQLEGGACDFTGSTSPRRDLVGFIRLLRRLEIRAWIRPLPPVKGWLNNGFPAGAAQDRKAAAAWLHELENLLAPQTEKHGGPIAFVESTPGMLDAPQPPSPVAVVSAHDAGGMTRSRQVLASARGTLLWEDVEDALVPVGWELAGNPIYRAGAVSLSGEERPTVSALRRNAALLRHWAPLLPAMRPQTAHPVRLTESKLPAGVSGVQLVSRAPGIASAVSITNDGRQNFESSLRAWDPFNKRPVTIEKVALVAHSTLWLPVNVSLGDAGLCRDCSAFSQAEHIVYATAELQTIEYENGTLAMEFAAPQAGEVVLQLARKPIGPYLAGGHPTDFEYDDKTLRVRLKIPAGKGPASQVRVALAIEPPEQSAFFDDTRRLIIGQANTIATSYSSERLADRSRLLLPDGFASKAVKKSDLAIEYAVEVPADALHGDWANLAIEADGVPLGRARLQMFRPVSVRLTDAMRLHIGSAELLVEPPIIPIDAGAGRTVDVAVKNNAAEMRAFSVLPSGEAFQFLPVKAELDSAAVADRVISFRVFPDGAVPGLHDWTLRLSGAAQIDIPARFLAIPRGRALAWSADLDGDGSPEWVLENQRARAVFSTKDGGRWLEFVWKEAAPTGLNVLPENGALVGSGPVEVRAGDGELVFAGNGWKRTVRLEDAAARLTVEQTSALPAETLKSGKHNEITFEVRRESGRTVYVLSK